MSPQQMARAGHAISMRAFSFHVLGRKKRAKTVQRRLEYGEEVKNFFAYGRNTTNRKSTLTATEQNNQSINYKTFVQVVLPRD